MDSYRGIKGTENIKIAEFAPTFLSTSWIEKLGAFTPKRFLYICIMSGDYLSIVEALISLLIIKETTCGRTFNFLLLAAEIVIDFEWSFFSLLNS